MERKGFTITELMVVVLIMAILMAIAVPLFLRAKARAEAKACRANLTLIDSAKKEWALDNPNLADDPGRPTQADISTYIDGGFGDLPACPFDNSSSPATSYDMNDMLDPDCANGNMSLANCSNGPDGAPDGGEDDDHQLP